MTKTLMVMAGGTGGHVFPGLAVAQQFRQMHWRVVWLGHPEGMEARLVAQHGFEMQALRFGGVRQKGLKVKLLLPFNLLKAMWRSRAILKQVNPDVVLGMGGYITFPAGLMSYLMSKPLVLHEQNAVAGLVNKVLAKLAKRVLVAFPDALPNAQWVGNPVRQDVCALEPVEQRYRRRQGPLQVLVVGGSLGASVLNEVVPCALSLIPSAQRPFVVHQAGEKHLAQLKMYYQTAGLAEDERVRLLPFIDDMAQAYAQADVVICRAGAMTVSEIAAAGVAALFVPFPFAVDDHQTVNATFLVKQQGAVLMQQKILSPTSLAKWLQSQQREDLLKMALNAQKMARPDATQRVVEICMQEVRKDVQ